MKRIALIVVLFTSAFITNAQETNPAPKPKINLANRAADHFVFQLSSDSWTNMPDSIASHQEGLSRGFNAYLMVDKPFRNAPHFSVAFGVGYGSTNMRFEKMQVDVKNNQSVTLPFKQLDSTDHFKKYKLHLGYLEVPFELRYSSKPGTQSGGWKPAVGAKVGTLINVHTKGKELQNKNNTTINSFTQKENSKKYFNGTRLSAMARVGYGIFSIFGSYTITGVLKDGVGPDMKGMQIGISLGGL